MRETVTIAEAARILDVRRDTIYKAIKDNRLKPIDCGGKSRILKEELDTFEKSKRGRPRKPKEEAL